MIFCLQLNFFSLFCLQEKSKLSEIESSLNNLTKSQDNAYYASLVTNGKFSYLPDYENKIPGLCLEDLVSFDITLVSSV